MGERVLHCTKKMASEQSLKGAEESAPLMLGECGKCLGRGHSLCKGPGVRGRPGILEEVRSLCVWSRVSEGESKEGAGQVLQGLMRRRQWHPTPVLLPRKSHGQRSLVGCSPWGR